MRYLIRKTFSLVLAGLSAFLLICTEHNYAFAAGTSMAEKMQTLVLQSITISLNSSTWDEDTISISNTDAGMDDGEADPTQDLEIEITEDEKAEASKDVIKSTTLKQGDDSHEVTLMQERLMDLYYLELDESTGYYGSNTTEAVKLFQRTNKLTIDGVAGKETLDLLFSEKALKYTIRKGDSGSDVSSLQRRLKSLGYYTGSITGYFGSSTQSSLIAFQKANKLTADGKAGIKTRTQLYSDNAIKKKTSTTTKPAPTAKPTNPPENSNPAPGNPTNVNAFLDFAQAQLGKKYVRGNEGPNSFDCSGYVYYCLKSCGVSTGRLSAAGFSQVSKWPSVSKSNLQPGDILFFGLRGSASVGHTGIYLGNNKMIHCSSSKGKVVITDITGSYWKENYKSARRVF